MLRPIEIEKYSIAGKYECTTAALEHWEELMPCGNCKEECKVLHFCQTYLNWWNSNPFFELYDELKK